MMCVGHRDGERVGRILGLRIGFRQQHADHQPDLRLLGVPGADTLALIGQRATAGLRVVHHRDLPARSAALSDRRFAAALAVAALSGFVRGFPGFGSALIYIPLIAAIYEPRIAAPTLLLIDLAGSTPFTIRELPRCNWREVVPVTTAAALAVPLGPMALLFIDPIVLRWFIAVLVLGLLAVLASGWRYHAKPTLPVSIGVGLFAARGSV